MGKRININNFFWCNFINMLKLILIFLCNIPNNSNLIIYKDYEAHNKKQDNIFVIIFKMCVHSRPQAISQSLRI